jgi:hypothetical protein
MQEKDLSQESEIRRLGDLENPEILGFLDSEYCPSNFKKFYETAKKNAQVDSFMGVDVIAAGFICNFLFWLAEWICANLPKVVLISFENITSPREEELGPHLADAMEEVHELYSKVTEKTRNQAGPYLAEYGITPDLPLQFINYKLDLPNLSQAEKEFIIFWGKVREYASDDLGIYIRDWPQFVKYDIFKSKLIRFSYPEAREDIERSLETPDENELKHILAPFYHPREGTFIIYDADQAAERQNMKRVLSPSVETLLSYAIHECIGHGFFYGQTAVGKQLSSSKAVQLLMTEKVEPSFEIERNEETRRLQQFRKETQILREGFAYWVQLCLLRKLKRACPDLSLDEEIEKVSQLINEEAIAKWNPYSVGFHLFKKIEDHNGELCVARALQIACNMKSPGDFRQRLVDISETYEKTRKDARVPTFSKNDLNWFDYAVNYVWNYKLPRIRFSLVIKFSYVREQSPG